MFLMQLRSNVWAAAVVLIHILTVYALVLHRGGDPSVWWHDGSALMALWATAPQLVLLLLVSRMGSGASRGLALVLLWLFASAGLAILTWGLAVDPGDYNHLVVIFLPIHQFEVLIVVAVAAGLVHLVRRAFMNRAGFPGGGLAWVTRPQIRSPSAGSSGPLPQLEECFRSARAGVGG